MYNISAKPTGERGQTMIEYTPEEFKSIIENRDKSERLVFNDVHIRDIDFSGADLTNIELIKCHVYDCNFDGADFTGSSIFCTGFNGCTMKDAIFRNCDMRQALLRYIDFGKADIRGADLHCACFEYSNTDGMIADDTTKWWKMICPEEGAFIAWKCTIEPRVVMLLVPADAKRVSATMETGRCSKAKVLSIKSIDETESFTWGQSTVDPDFIYEVGKMMYPANGFEESRWRDSSQGIHFFMERQQAIDYLTK